jgi:hypothetical protein
MLKAAEKGKKKKKLRTDLHIQNCYLSQYSVVVDYSFPHP